jgi:predicted Holliday junction resolvase-like endonuclease
VTVLEVVLGLIVVVLWLAMIRLHAEVMVLRRERDETAKQIKALATAYRRGVDRRPERR